jgi:hypothetical protein
MKISRKTEISIRQTKRLVVLLPETEVVISCTRCQTVEPMIIAELAASVLGFSRREVYRLVEAGGVHFAETDQGVLYICQNSFERNLTGDQIGNK